MKNACLNIRGSQIKFFLPDTSSTSLKLGIYIKKMSERQTKAGNQITLSHSLILSLSHSLLTLSLFHSLIHSLSTCWTTFVFMSMLKNHSLTFTLSHSLILSFNHSRHAEQVLFSSLCSKVAVYSRKLQCFFLDRHSHTRSCEFRSHRAGSQLKNHELSSWSPVPYII